MNEQQRRGLDQCGRGREVLRPEDLVLVRYDRLDARLQGRLVRDKHFFLVARGGLAGGTPWVQQAARDRGDLVAIVDVDEVLGRDAKFGRGDRQRLDRAWRDESLRRPSIDGSVAGGEAGQSGTTVSYRRLRV